VGPKGISTLGARQRGQRLKISRRRRKEISKNTPKGRKRGKKLRGADLLEKSVSPFRRRGSRPTDQSKRRRSLGALRFLWGEKSSTRGGLSNLGQRKDHPEEGRGRTREARNNGKNKPKSTSGRKADRRTGKKLRKLITFEFHRKIIKERHERDWGIRLP